MTTNQMIVLLQIHRGDENLDNGRGTTVKDIDYLRRRGLIVPAFVSADGQVIKCPEGNMWTTTEKGNNLLRAALACGSK